MSTTARKARQPRLMEPIGSKPREVADGLCVTCNSSGLVWRNAKTFAGKRAVGWQEFCPECNGSGRRTVNS